MFESIKEGATSLKERAIALSELVEDESTKKGMSILEAKNYLLLSYTLNLLYYARVRARGEEVKDHAVIERLLYLKTML